MRVFQINTVANSGSTGKIAEDIGKYIVSRGGHSYIGYSRLGSSSSSILYHIGNFVDKYFHGLITRLFDLHGYGSFFSTLRLIRYIKKKSPDLIHLHNIHGYYLNYYILFRYLSKSDIPVVWTLHDCWSFTGHCAYYSYVGCEKWKICCSKCIQKKSYPKSVFFDNSRLNYLKKKRSFLSCTKLTLVPVSTWLYKELKQSFFENMSSIIINNGIDTEIFKPNSCAKKEIRNFFEGKYLILAVAGEWVPRKGLSDIIELSNYLLNDEMIVVVGLKNDQIKRLPSNICGIPSTENREELVSLYSASDVFINFSYEETFGLTTLEAMSCGTPAIVYDTTALPEVVGEHGYIVKPKDFLNIISIIRSLKNTSLKNTKDNIRQYVIENYSIENQRQSYWNLYNSILKK